MNDPRPLERPERLSFLAFLAARKWWWVLPILTMLVWLAVLLALQEQGAGTFVYRMF